ncbi:TRAP transporter substrate-binding protein [Sinisalibacter aestuarii]|uniref:ABC transporter substrate-binding protein n=1 Tax=Sinisalibacter aestuarii TaxID=2949426 RepID=A0ABQ5LUF5_9RHOB|nr:TRAP transporter substrate-binding protein [Sinisalibacter aestuarii]GKY87742.1 ABC transporter substrate-binding protein [Sinisalibacter aestuarii]
MKYFAVATAAVAAVLSAGAGHADTYTLQTFVNLQAPSIGPSPVHFAERVSLMSGGDITIEVHEPGSFVPAYELFGAVSSGALDMGYDWTGYWASQIPVASIVAAMPFGPSPDVTLAWMLNGGGKEIIQKAYDPFNVHFIPCHVPLSEAGGWFNKEINSVDDFKGMNIRFAGLGGNVLAKLGANTQAIPPGEIYLGLETGRLDATEFGTPQLDVGMGFQNVTKYYYFPGWHQVATINSIIVNGTVWDQMDARDQQILEEACLANIAFNLADMVHAQAGAIAQIREAGVEIRRFPDEVLQALRVASAEVLEEEATKDPLFAEALESLRSYVDTVGEWEELQAIPPQQD